MTSTEQLERETEQTRARLTETLEELRSMTPGRVVDEVLDYAKTGGGDFLRNMGSKLGHQVAENPLPAALIGAGVIWLMMSDGKAHNGNFLLLGHDDLLGQSPDLRVATVAKHRKRHVDRTLMVRNHHRDKVRVDVAGRLYRHVVHHFSHGGLVLDQEGGFRTDTGDGCRADVQIGHWEQLGRRKEGGSDDE